MATPVGHFLIGAAIGAGLSHRDDTRRNMAVGGFVGMAADLDFIPGWLAGELSRFHHAQSHSLAFAVLAATLAMLIARQERLHWGLLVGLVYMSHLALDMLTYDDSPPQGIPLLWPWWSGVFLSPITLLPNVLHGKGQELSAHNVAVAAREIALLGSLLVGTLLFARRLRRGSVPPGQPGSRHIGKRLSMT
jgi:membrane-bound metal-dependent hydrolase YbcI (DUF457 family)